MSFLSHFLLRLMKFGLILLRPSFFRAFFVHQVMAGVEHRVMLTSTLSTVVDIGANRGQFALAVRVWAPNARVISFEPLPGPAQVFLSVFSGDERVILHKAAVGPESKTCEMHVSERDDSSSLLPIAALQSEIFPGTAEVSSINVQVGPLEDFIKPEEIKSPAMLKLDVQGFEYEALCGCESLLSLFDLIYCECSFVELYSGQKLAADVIDWLSSRGFRIEGIYNSSYDRNGRAIQADFLFCRSR